MATCGDMNENDTQRKSVYWHKFEIKIESNILHQKNKGGNVISTHYTQVFILSLQKQYFSTLKESEDLKGAE